jgi:ParB family transcriptional regulator, chromosome partitioning protein
MSDASNTHTETLPDGSMPVAEASDVLVAPSEKPREPESPDTPSEARIETMTPMERVDEDAIGVEPHEVPRHFSAPAFLALERLDPDQTFRVRPLAELEDVTALATDIARLGQLFPIDVRLVPPDRIQVITGFRRVAALRFLQREKVVARLHTELSDKDAALMAIASAIHSRSVTSEALRAVQERLELEGRLSPPARDMLAKALAVDDALSPENVEEEVDADELAADVTIRLSQCNQDLSLLADVFDQLDDERRDSLLTQLRYSMALVSFLESKK